MRMSIGTLLYKISKIFYNLAMKLGFYLDK